MKRWVVVCSSLTFALLIALSGWTKEDATRVKQILDRVDKLYRSKSSKATVEMTVVSPHYTRTMKLKFWTKGMNKTFILVLEPKKDRGIATLRIDKDMWNYFPKIDRVLKVPPSMMMGAWMGSDFTNDDLVKESTLLDDYNARLIKADSEQPDNYFIELTPKSGTVSLWAKIILVVRKSDLMPIRQEFFDEDGKKVRVLYFKDVKELGGRRLPTVLEMVPLTKPGHKTVVRYIDAEFDVSIDESVFSLRNLKKQRR